MRRYQRCRYIALPAWAKLWTSSQHARTAAQWPLRCATEGEGQDPWRAEFWREAIRRSLGMEEGAENERRTKSEDVSPWLLLVQDGLAKSHCSQVTSKTDYCGFKLWCAANVLGSSDKTCHARARGGQSWKPSVVIVRRARDVVRGGDGPDGGCGDSVRGRQWGRGLDSCGFDTGRGMAGLEMG